jgi:predicted amidohydrolase YtcJ
MRIASVLAAVAVSLLGQPLEEADLLLHSGRILSMNDAGTTYEALAVRNGRIVAAGGAELRSRFRAARAIDLRGRTASPGFNDAYIHISGDPRREIDMTGVRSIADLQQRIRAKAVELGPGEWVTGYGWSEDELTDRRKPLRADLDAAAPANPVMMTRAGGHSAVFNSLALELGKVTRDTRDPEGGVIERDESGEPSGVIREEQEIIAKLIPPAPPAELRASFIGNLRKLLPLGITSIVQAGVNVDDGFRMWESVYREHGATLPRATVQISWPGLERLKAFGRRPGDGNERFRVGAIKLFVDGGFTGPAAYTLRPYRDQADYRGKLVRPERELYEILRDGHAAGWQFGLHTIGDGAIVLAVDTFERVLRERPRADHRHYLNHFSMLPPEATLRTMQTLGLLIVQQPNFTYTVEGRYAANLEGDRLAHNNPVATAIRHGIFMAFSSDILPIGPTVGLYAAATRKGMSGAVYAADERVSVYDALRMYTRNGAFVTREEQLKGTLDVGRLADIIVFERDPLRVEPDAVKDLAIDLTIVGGAVLHERMP